MKFRGISEVTILSSFLRDFLYDRTQPNTQLTSSNLKGSNVSLNQALSSRVRPAEDHRSVFQSSQASRSREGEWEERRWMGGQWPLEGSRHLGT